MGVHSPTWLVKSTVSDASWRPTTLRWWTKWTNNDGNGNTKN